MPRVSPHAYRQVQEQGKEMKPDNTNGPLAHGVCQNCGHEKSLRNYIAEGDATMPYLAPHERALFGKEEWNG